MNDERFDELLKGLRDEPVTPDQVERAQERVWHKLSSSRSLACDDFSSDLEGYASGRLAESRRLLVEDHLSRCVECRHALAEVKGESKVVQMPAAPRRLPAWTRWAVAAGVALAVLYLGRGGIDSALAPSGPGAIVVSISGTLYEPSGMMLDQGAEVARGTPVRTAAGSHAVLRLRDGSEVEMNERTELAVHGAFSGDTVRLDRGDIIVEAAEQGRGRLRVVTRDSIAAVKGTVFAVSSSTSGSLVSVMEGSVEVSQTGYKGLLVAGEQAASSPVLGHIGMMQAVSWSQDAGNYYGLIAELSRIEEQLASSGPAMRRDASLLA
jgi:ferric-dicitrate binding protein FerR (iron transport regulator)